MILDWILSIQNSSKALVVSYEGSRAEDLDPYLANRLYPLQPLVLWGRTADIVPKVSKKHAVLYWWKDLHVGSVCSICVTAIHVSELIAGTIFCRD